MASPDNILSSPQAAKLLKDKEAVNRLVQSPDTQALLSKLNQSAGGGLQAAAQQAMQGDLSQLQSLLSKAMADPTTAQMMNRISKDAQGN